MCACVHGRRARDPLRALVVEEILELFSGRGAAPGFFTGTDTETVSITAAATTPATTPAAAAAAAAAATTLPVPSQENFAEDPLLVAAYAVAATRGVQGLSPTAPGTGLAAWTYVGSPATKATSQAKHFAAYGAGSKDGCAHCSGSTPHTKE
jgi:hypothetical protein